jgi:hypothetical protein
MHLHTYICMQDDQISQKIMPLVLADMARLPPFVTTKLYFLAVYKQPSQSAGTTPTLNFEGKSSDLM